MAQVEAILRIVGAEKYARKLTQRTYFNLDAVTIDPFALVFYSRKTIYSGEMAEWLKAHAWKACLG